MTTNQYGPKTPQAQKLHAMKYRGEGEDFREAMGRVAFALKDDDHHYHALREVLLDQRFCPGGRIQAAMGATRRTTAYNCMGAETEVLTSQGFVSVKDLVGRQFDVLSPVSGLFHAATARSFGTQLLNKITISNSRFGQARSGTFTVRATANHRWLLQDGTETDSLTEGQLLRAGRCETSMDDVAWVHGFVFGDGTRQRAGKFLVRMCGDKAKHLGVVLRAFPLSRVTYPQSLLGDPCVTLECDVDMKSLPTGKDAIYEGSFVEGLLAADGCFSNRGNDPYQFHGPREIVEWVRDRLVLADYAPCGRAHEHDAEPTNYGDRSVVMWKQVFRRSEDHKGFRVVSIEPYGEEEVYCVVETAHHAFTLRNGLATGNCFVSGSIEDTFVHGQASIMGRAHQAAATMRMGGGIGYDFSTLRPRGFRVVKIDSQASGPVSFMPIFDAVCLATASFGHRRGAQMGALRCDHPDVEEFIAAKQNNHALRGFNVSVAVTDDLMEAVDRGSTFWLKWRGENYKEVDAAALWERIMRSTWDWAEPGVLFVDTINRMNNLWYCETIAATNPCGEQPLPPYGACLLGSFNLTKYLRRGMANTWYFDTEQLIEDVPLVVRAMDNVVDRTVYPLAEQRGEAVSKRRMGIGVMGLANAGEALGCPYGTPEFAAWEESLLEVLNVECYRASAALAAEKGAFPLFDAERYLAGAFVRKLPGDVRDMIARGGIRNSHLTSIAPTGTISMCCDNVSSGVEPVFTLRQERPINTPDGVMIEVLEDYGSKFLGVTGRECSEVTAEEHVRVLIAAQKNVDSAVSKTCNVDGSMPWENFKAIYRAAYDGGAKGCTTFNKDGQRFGLLAEARPARDEGEGQGVSCEVGADGRRSCE